MSSSVLDHHERSTFTGITALWLANFADWFCAISNFDMVKPWPISLLDRHVHGGFGIMIDDVLAGVFAAISLWLVVLYL